MYRHAPSTDRVHPVVCLAAGWRDLLLRLSSTEPELSKSHLCRSKKTVGAFFYYAAACLQRGGRRARSAPDVVSKTRLLTNQNYYYGSTAL